jgi:creatinine amidohydrolase/Fe(II)-dependent formamide hydrolase-like protein
VEGDASKASPEAGETIVSQTVRTLVEKVEEFMRK